MLGLEWFNDRIGKEVLAYSSWWGYTRIVKIKNKPHARYLFGWYYKYKNWQFSEYEESEHNKTFKKRIYKKKVKPQLKLF